MIAIPANHRTLNAVSPINWLHPLTRGLVSWWMYVPGWTGGARWPDLCNRSPGTLTNMNPATDWISAQGRPGGFGALDFAPSGNQHVLSSYLALSSGPFTMAGWIYFIGISNDIWIAQATTADDDVICWSSAGEFRWENHNMTNSPRQWNSIFATGAWYHWCLVQPDSDTGNAGLYINGISKGSNSASGNAGSTSTGGFRLGSRANGLGHNGYLDDVCVWNRYLSASEVLALYNDSRRGHPEMLNWIQPAYYLGDVVAPGGLSIPVAMAQYRQRWN